MCELFDFTSLFNYLTLITQNENKVTNHIAIKEGKKSTKRKTKTAATPTGLEPMTFEFASQCHNHYANESLHYNRANLYLKLYSIERCHSQASYFNY